MTSLESTPQIIERPAQPYVAVREAVTKSTLSRIADHIPELFGWLAQRGQTPSGAPFFRYLTVDMERELQVEAGVPVAAPVDSAEGAGGAVTAQTLPGGLLSARSLLAIPTASRTPQPSSCSGQRPKACGGTCMTAPLGSAGDAGSRSTTPTHSHNPT
jgi:hypothetical protein